MVALFSREAKYIVTLMGACQAHEHGAKNFT